MFIEVLACKNPKESKNVYFEQDFKIYEININHISYFVTISGEGTMKGKKIQFRQIVMSNQDYFTIHASVYKRIKEHLS